MALPIERVNVTRLKAACTISYLPMGEPEPLTLKHYKLTKDYIYVPRQLGLQVCNREGIEYEDRTSPGVAVTFPRIPLPRDYQGPTLDLIGTTMDDYYDFLFRARTGWGKTYGSLIVAARRGVSTLIIVDQDNLKEQWIKTLIEGFGFKREDIGLIQGQSCKFEGCAVTIAMVQTLSQKRLTQAAYDYFGLILVDEVHTIGAPTFSRPLMDFSAGYRMGVSATPKRRDGLQKVLDFNLGRVRVYVEDQHAENSLYIADHDSTYSWYSQISPKVGRFITEVSEDASRNLLVAESAAYLYDTGRDVLVLSDRIEHLQHLMSLCTYLGIPAEEMGLYAGYNPVYRYAKDPNPLRRPNGYVRGTEYTPISLQLIAKRLNRKTLEGIQNKARIIFATYGMFSKGVDVPRLTGGVDATPRSRAEQIHGRILRQLENAMRALWITIADRNSYRSLHGLLQRIPEYAKNNARVYQWSLDGGEAEWQIKALKAELASEVKRLKSLRIETNSVGLHTLTTQSNRIANARQHVAAISRNVGQPRSGGSPMVSSHGARTGRSHATPSKSLSPASPLRYRRRQRP